MTYSKSPLAFSHHALLWERAVTSKEGIVIKVGSYDAAFRLRSTLYAARVMQRATLESAHGPGTECLWDMLFIRMSPTKGGAYELRILPVETQVSDLDVQDIGAT